MFVKTFLALSFVCSLSFAQTKGPKDWTVDDLKYRPCGTVDACQKKVNLMKSYLTHCKKVANGSYACADNHIKLAKDTLGKYEQDYQAATVARPLSHNELQSLINSSESVPAKKPVKKSRTSQ